MNETTDNFWTAWALPVEPPAIAFYRLYYDDNGYLLFYSMENISGNYIEIDKDTYFIGPSNIRVINGQLHYIKTNIATKLVISSTQGQACDHRDVAVISTNTNRQYWKLKTTDEEN